MNFSMWPAEKMVGTFRRKISAQGTLSEASKVVTICYLKIRFEFLLRIPALEEKCTHVTVFLPTHSSA